jgi:antitoxin (DNA-binding transcriptional repressor) of toxin-antitoxin stability system
MMNVNVTEFRKNIQTYLAEVQTGQTVQLLRRGKVVAVLSPPSFAEDEARLKLETLRLHAKVGDVISSVDEIWEAERAHS